MSSRHYHIDELGRVVLIGLTADETIEYERLSDLGSDRNEPPERFVELHEKHRRSTVRHLCGMTTTSSPVPPEYATESDKTQTDEMRVSDSFDVVRKRKIVIAFALAAVGVVGFAMIAIAGINPY
jgi:hypothetical protein